MEGFGPSPPMLCIFWMGNGSEDVGNGHGRVCLDRIPQPVDEDLLLLTFMRAGYAVHCLCESPRVLSQNPNIDA